jgi:hypothetical protein
MDPCHGHLLERKDGGHSQLFPSERRSWGLSDLRPRMKPRMIRTNKEGCFAIGSLNLPDNFPPANRDIQSQGTY